MRIELSDEDLFEAIAEYLKVRAHTKYPMLIESVGIEMLPTTGNYGVVVETKTFCKDEL